MAFVYAYFRLNGEPCYIGKGKDDRWAVHLTRKTNPHLWNIIQQAKALGRELPVVILRDDITDAAAIEIERTLIAAIGRADLGQGPLVNLTDGGDGHAGYRQSDELKERRRQEWTPERRAAYGEYSRRAIHGDPEVRARYEMRQREGAARPETREKAASGRRGKTNSEEHRERMRQWNAERWSDPEKRAALVAKHRALAVTPERRQQLRDALASPEVKAKISAASKAMWARRKATQNG